MIACCRCPRRRFLGDCEGKSRMRLSATSRTIAIVLSCAVVVYTIYVWLDAVALQLNGIEAMNDVGFDIEAGDDYGGLCFV